MRTWIYAIDTFESNTRNSHVAALSLSADHKAKIQAQAATDTDFFNMHAAFTPIYDAYQTISAQHDSATGIYHGRTFGFEEILRILNEQKLREWEAGIRFVYLEDSEEERTLFPRKRVVFQSGTYEDRVLAVRTLKETLGSYPLLASVLTNVTSFYNTMLSTREVQQNQEGMVDNLSTLREEQRVLVCIAMYGNLGLLMNKFRATPERITDFFDMSLLRNSAADNPFTFDGTAPVGISQVGAGMGNPDLELTADTEMTITNKGTIGLLTFYFTSTENSMPGSVFVTVAAGETRTVTLGSIGFPADFFQVQNTGSSPLDYKIEI